MVKIANKIKNYINIIIEAKKTKSSVNGILHLNDIFLSYYNRIGRKCYINVLKMGKYSYIGNNCKINKTIVGNYTSIGSNLNIIYGNHPTSKYVSTHPFFYSTFQTFDRKKKVINSFEEYSYVDKEKNYFVSIGNDVWIGDNVSILNGVKIGDGAIIAAGSFVNKDVPSYAIVGGVPAKILKYRFNEEQIMYLTKLCWWDKDDSWIKKNFDKFNNIEKFTK